MYVTISLPFNIVTISLYVSISPCMYILSSLSMWIYRVEGPLKWSLINKVCSVGWIKLNEHRISKSIASTNCWRERTSFSHKRVCPVLRCPVRIKLIQDLDIVQKTFGLKERLQDVHLAPGDENLQAVIPSERVQRCKARHLRLEKVRRGAERRLNEDVQC